MSKGTVILGLSGGVDSSVAAFLLKEQGYEVIGITMINFREQSLSPGICDASEKSAADAAAVARYLGIPHMTVNFTRKFENQVINHFVAEYLNGRTPNPCVVCNRFVKWEAMLAKCRELGGDYLATGHYARIERLKNGRYAVMRSASAQKDQTYALYRLTQEQLSRTLMPVGDFPKEEIRRIAERAGIPVADKPDSMEICFIPDKDYAGFIERRCGALPKGNYVNAKGELLGRHEGIIHYTIGQRKGLGLAMGHPVFVTEIRPKTNEVVIGEKEELFSSTLLCNQLSAMGVESLDTGMQVQAKIRYNHKGASAVLERVGEDELICRFQEPQRAVAPGQAVVFYQGDAVAGGGTIKGKMT